MRVLIAEDNEAFRDILSVVLRGHEVIVAEDGAEAVEMAQCYRPDIVLMDVLMPEMDGFMALERLKADEATAGIPVVLMSAGCTNAHYAERGLSLGAADYLKKPFDILGLPKLLEGYVAKKKARGGSGPPTTLQSNHNQKGASKMLQHSVPQVSQEVKDVLDRINAIRERNRKEYKALARMTGLTVAEVEADLTAPDPGLEECGDEYCGEEPFRDSGLCFKHFAEAEMALWDDHADEVARAHLVSAGRG